MKDESKDESKDVAQKQEGDGLAERDKRYARVRAAGGSPRAAVRAYCAGNRWLTENAKGVGNW